MRDFLTSSGRYLRVGWFWAAVLLILPNCGFRTSFVPGPGNNFDPGSSPHSSVVFCDIVQPAGRHCATAAEQAAGVRLASAAMALVAGQTGIGLDDSPAALARCGGEPEAVLFQAAFPEGLPVCLNCAETIVSGAYADANAVCQARCHDFFGTTEVEGSLTPDNPPTAETVAFCAANAHASTNFPLNACYEDACLTSGTLRLDFADPRRIPEPVTWRDLIGASAAGGSLTRTAATSGLWDAGAASTQLITGGDGYVEFTATETTLARMAGLSSGAPPDTDANFTNIGFGIDLFSNGEISVFESGILVSTFGAYASGEKFRVKVKDNFDGTATITYVRLTGPCVDGMPCNETVFHTSSVAGAYPFRVDSSLFDQGATLTDVRLVRIH